MQEQIESLIESELDAYLSSTISNKLPIHFANKAFSLESSDVDRYTILSNIPVSEAVEKRIKYHEDSLDPNNLYDGLEPDNDSISESDIIDDIFDR